MVYGQHLMSNRCWISTIALKCHNALMLDPRTKLILTFIFTVMVAVTAGIFTLAGQWAILAILIIGLRKTREYLHWLRLVVPMAVFFGGVTWWAAGIMAGCFAALKLLTLTSVFFIFFAVTSPEDMANSLVKVGLPYTAAFVFSTAMQFVPVIGRKARDILDAQRARGIPMAPGWAALRHYPAFLIPLLIQSFQLAEELAEAMEARGFSRKGRTFLKEYRLRPLDWAIIVVGLCLLIVLLIFKNR